MRLTVHPHARGENASPSRWPAAPPRSTPTRVGRTVRNCSCTVASSVHPHARGENWKLPREIVAEAGPPPRAWGERSRSTTRFQLGGPPPRAWGEQKLAIHDRPRARSTPTRVGRTLRLLCPTTPTLRSTPTRVGRTGLSRVRRGEFPVHPHARGENDRRNARRVDA